MNRKPRIAVFLPSLQGGGAERALVLFARTAQELGCEVELVCADKNGVLLPLIDSRLPVVDLKAPRMMRAVKGLRRYLRERRPDAVYASIVHANLAVVLAARGMGKDIKVILRESNAPLSEKKRTWSRKLSHLLAPFLYRRAHRIIAVSAMVRDELVQMSSALAKKIEVLQTPVVPANFIAQAAEEPGHLWFSPGEPPVVLGVGRLHPQKNFALLIRAFANVRAQRVCRLIILGRGALQKELQALAESLGVAEDVSFAGFSLNPFAYMSRARLFVLSSDYEGMPNVLLQAMALGTPVISTDCPGGSAECLDGGRLGTLVPTGDVEKMSEAIAQGLDAMRREDAAEIITRQYGAEPATRAYLECAGIALPVKESPVRAQNA